MTLPVAEAAIADTEEARREFAALVDSLSPADWSRPVPYGQWTVKDVVAHVVGDLTAGLHGMLVSGQLDPRTILTLARTYDPGPANAQIVAFRKDTSPQELRELLDRSMEPVFDAIRQMKPEHLGWPIPLGPDYEITTEDYLWGDYHFRTHIDEIRRALAVDYQPEELSFLPAIQEKVAGLQRARERFIRAAYSVADDAWDEPSAFPGWTYCHTLAHVAANDLRVHTRLRALLGDRNEAALAALADVHTWNQHSVEERSGCTTAELMDEFAALRHETLRILSRLQEEHLGATFTVSEEGEFPLLEYFDLVAEHELRHGGDLVPASRARRWRAQHPDTT